MDRRSLFEAEAEAEAEGKKPSAFGRRQKQKVFRFEMFKVSQAQRRKKNFENRTKIG